MATGYPVTFNVPRPEKFERPQVVLRILVIVLLSILAGAVGWIFGVLYLAIPVLAAVFISQGGGEAYFKDTKMPMILRWYLALYCYLAVLIDRFPTEEPENIISFEVRPSGSPTVGSALLRLIVSIPSAFVLALLGIVGAVIWVIAVVSILIQENYSTGLYDFQLGIMRWQARLLGYHASLVDEYPPFAVDTGPEQSEPGEPSPAPTV
jgi:hypothetical protein